MSLNERRETGLSREPVGSHGLLGLLLLEFYGTLKTVQ